MGMNVSPETRHTHVLFHSDLVFAGSVLFLGVSVGYVGNLCLTHAPKLCSTPQEQEATNLVLTIFFVIGQATGSALSYIVLEST